MNIFAVDVDPKQSARDLSDKHVVKMIVEGCQMLSTNHRLHSSHILYPGNNLYKQSFQNHPCTIWARKTADNYLWLAKHTLELSEEYTRRYGRIHKAHDMCLWFVKQIPCSLQFYGKITPFAQAMPDEFKVPDDGVAAYRKYYIGAKSKIAKWKFTNPPEWYVEGLTNAPVMV